MLDILTIIHNFADIQTASRIRRTCRRLAALTPEPTLYSKPYNEVKYKYRVGSKLHRLDGPAKEDEYGCKYWYRGGIGHREYHPQRTEEYFRGYMVDGIFHRDVGPCIIYTNSTAWYLRGDIHRKTGEACVLGTWYTLGKWHRLDGPAYGEIYVIRGVEHHVSGSMCGVWLIDGVIIRV